MAKEPKVPLTEAEETDAAAAALQAQLAALRAELTAMTSAAGQAAIAERASLKAQVERASRPQARPSYKTEGSFSAATFDARGYRQQLLQQDARKRAEESIKRQLGLTKQITAAGSAGGGPGKSGPIETVEAGNKGLRLLAKNLGISKAQLRAPLVAGGIELTKLAMGIRGMAQLSAIEVRAGFMLRQLFKGVDASPVIRAAYQLSQVFNKTTVTGKALEGIFGRAFNYIFGQVEKLAPYAHTAFQGMVLAALLLENGWLRASIALQPLTDAIESIVGPTDDMQTAAWLGGAAFLAIAGAAAVAAAPVLAVAAAFKAVSAAIAEATALIREWDSEAFSKANKAGKFKEGSDEAAAAFGARKSSDAEFAALRAADDARNREARAGAPKGAAPTETGAPAPVAKAQGAATGAAYADGLAGGIATGAPEVAGAAGALAGVIDPKVRAVTQTRSPSRVAMRTGAEQPAGMAQGIRGGIPDVEAAAGDMGGAANAGARGGSSATGQTAAASGGPIKIEIVNHWPAGVAADGVLEARFADMMRKAVRDISIALGRPVATT